MQAYNKNLGGRQRLREAPDLVDGFSGAESKNRYTDSAVKKMVNRLKSEKG